MRWVPWVLGIAGVLQHAIIAYVQPDGYVGTDMSYLVMWLAIIGALLLCYASCWDCYGDGGCGCCGDDCSCGDCEACMGKGNGHEGHGHDGGHAH